MRDKKSPEPDATPEEQVLVRKVDAMMDPKAPDPQSQSADGQPPALDIFKGLPDKPVPTVDTSNDTPPEATKTAPELSDSMPTSKKISVIDADRLRASTPPAAAEVDEPEAVTEDAPSDEPEPETLADVPANETTELKDSLDDSKTDAAVDQIAAQDGDTILAAEDAAAGKARTVVKSKRSFKDKLRTLFKDKRTWIGLAVILVVVAVIPWTRYKVAGLVIKRSIAITVVDSKTATAVSGAVVTFNGRHGSTDKDGHLLLRVPVGSSKLSVTKQYYHTSSQNLTAGFGSSPLLAHVQLVATGRQVPLTVINTITGKSLSAATVKVLNTTAKTNDHGQATIVLPASNGTAKATVSLAGYNTTTFTIQVTSSVVPANDLKLTPSGHVYFLSNRSGTIDVVSTNLDGSDRQIVFAGTGKEDSHNTSLLASRDWRYLVLESQHSGTQPALYLIDTSDNKTTEFDNSNADFTLIGWYGHDFMYDLRSNTVAQYQTGHEVIKSYDADTQQLNQLDSAQAQGNSTSYGYQTFNDFYILSNLLVYDTQWYSNDASGSGFDLSSDNDVIRSVQPSGQGKKDLHSLPATQVSYIQAQLYEPQAIYYAINSTSNQTTYYQLENQSLTANSSLTQATFSKNYPTYLISPSGKQTFWTDLRDGRNALFVGDQDSQNGTQLTSDGSYTPYGWYTDAYVLIAKDNDKLYIMPSSSNSTTTTPIQVSDYYKPAQDFNGYGYGYGGL